MSYCTFTTAHTPASNDTDIVISCEVTAETYNVYTYIPVNPFEKTATYKITLG